MNNNNIARSKIIFLILFFSGMSINAQSLSLGFSVPVGISEKIEYRYGLKAFGNYFLSNSNFALNADVGVEYWQLDFWGYTNAPFNISVNGLFFPFTKKNKLFISSGIKYFFHSLDQNGNATFIGERYIRNLELQNSFGFDISIGMIIFSKINFLIKTGYLYYKPVYSFDLVGVEDILQETGTLNINSFYFEVGIHFSVIGNN